MESKKKKKIIFISCIVTLIVVIVAISVIFAVQKINKSKEVSNNATNSSMITSTITLSNTYNEAIAEGLVPVNYNGNYKYSKIVSIEFNFSEYSEEDQQKYISTICANKGVKDLNGLIKLLRSQKEENSEDEVLVFQDGKYSRNVSSSLISIGTYIGDDNLTQVTLLSDSEDEEQEYFFVSLNFIVPEDAIEPSASSTELSSNGGTTLYVFEQFRSKENPDRILFTVTYAYEMFTINPTIPENELNF